MAQGKLAEALTSFRAGLAIVEALVRGNAGWRRDVAVPDANLGDVYRKANDLVQAPRHLTEGPAIIADLVARFPDWAEWKQDLTWFDGQIAALKQ